MISTTISEFANKSHVQNQLVKALFTVAAAATGTDSNTILVASASTFLSDGVLPGDLVTNVTDGSTATIVSVDSETQLTTDALSAAGTYDATEAYTILGARNSNQVFRCVLYPGTNGRAMIRQICAETDDNDARILIYMGSLGKK